MKYVINKNENKFAGKKAVGKAFRKVKGTIIMAGTILITTFGAFSVEAKAAVKPHYSEWTEHQVVAELADQNAEFMQQLKEIEDDIIQMELLDQALSQNPMANRDMQSLKYLQEKENAVTQQFYEADSRLTQVNNRLNVLAQAERESDRKQQEKQILEQRQKELEEQVNLGNATLDNLQNIYKQATGELTEPSYLNKLSEKMVMVEKKITHDEEAKKDMEQRVQAREESPVIRKSRQTEQKVLEKEKEELNKTMIKSKSTYAAIQDLKQTIIQNISRVANDVVATAEKENGKSK